MHVLYINIDAFQLQIQRLNLDDLLLQPLHEVDCGSNNFTPALGYLNGS